ncbi:MAG: tRNA (adenosine(37)-N6)-dimethylallyltransferase MiaA [Verrucomicrobiota bacterium]
MELPLLFILGPTAAGKSQVAHQLALEWGASILCMDSMQVYRDLEVGVGKPSAQERNEVSYRGIDLLNLDQGFDVAAYLQEAESFLDESREKKKPAIIVGGTGLYYRALTHGFSPVPTVDPEIRKRLEGLSLEELQGDLRITDPEMVSRIDFQNSRRLIRALEVKKGTGISLLEWQKRNEPPLISDFQAYFLNPVNLKERIQKRTLEMMRQGWLQEVKGLLEKWGETRVKGLAAIGYDILVDVLQGGLTEPEGVKRIQEETWQYARRQLTWFRKESKYQTLNLNADSSISTVIDSIRQSQERLAPSSPPLLNPLPFSQNLQDISCS